MVVTISVIGSDRPRFANLVACGPDSDSLIGFQNFAVSLLIWGVAFRVSKRLQRCTLRGASSLPGDIGMRTPATCSQTFYKSHDLTKRCARAQSPLQACLNFLSTLQFKKAVVYRKFRHNLLLHSLHMTAFHCVTP